MVTKSRFVEVPKEWKKVIELLRRAIRDRRLLRFYYESKNGNKGYRTVYPYMIIPRGKILELAGLPTIELSSPLEEREAGHYTVSQLKERLESNQLEVSLNTFDNPGVSREIVDNTQGTPVCRFIYNDEDAEKVKAQWLRIKYV